MKTFILGLFLANFSVTASARTAPQWERLKQFEILQSHFKSLVSDDNPQPLKAKFLEGIQRIGNHEYVLLSSDKEGALCSVNVVLQEVQPEGLGAVSFTVDVSTVQCDD